jgi:hypothetical protein
MTLFRRLFIICLGLLASLIIARPAVAQEASSPPATLNIFLDCSFYCDLDFIRTEVTYVSWVRDREAADVHILVTGQSTGGGGTEYTLAFIGLRSMVGMTDTLRYIAPQRNTPDMTRRGMTRVIKLGLARFLARTTTPENFNLTMSPVAGAAAPPTAAQSTTDPWNYWVFTVSGSGNTSGEKQSSFSSVSGSLTARRTTNDWKINISGRENYNESKFSFEQDDGTTRKTTSIRRSYTFSELAAKSLSPRLSAGLLTTAGASTFENKKFYYRITPAVEYDVFPYSESTRRMLTAQYSVGVEHTTYNEETIYERTRETLPLHAFSVNLSQTQQWGSANVGLNLSQYINMPDKNSASLFASTNVRVLKGLSFSLSGSYSRIHNQLSIPRRGATEEEVFLQQRRLETNYSYFAFASVNYTFGSIFNNVVNPRFGSGSTIIFF